MHAQPDLSLFDVDVQQIEDDITCQHTVAVVRLQMLADLEMNI